jgi:hypothetical protein
VEFFHQKGYLDNLDRIIWAAEPRAHLSFFSYRHLLAVASPTYADCTTSSSVQTCSRLCTCDIDHGAHTSPPQTVSEAGTSGSPTTGSSGLAAYSDSDAHLAQRIHAPLSTFRGTAVCTGTTAASVNGPNDVDACPLEEKPTSSSPPSVLFESIRAAGTTNLGLHGLDCNVGDGAIAMDSGRFGNNGVSE